MEKVHHQTSRKNARKTISTPWLSNITETEVFWKNHRNDFHGSWCSWFGTRKTRWKIENLWEKHWKTIEFTKWWQQLKKNIRKTGCYHFVIRYFHTKISGLLFALQQIFWNPELSTKLPQWWCAKSAKSAGSFLTQKKSCNSSPKCWFLQTKPVSSHGRSVVNKKKSPIFYGWHRSKEKLFSESSKGEDVFAPRSSGFCREKI